jgi:hypothetical protein
MTDTPHLIGAHASALRSLRTLSLQAYGIDPQALMERPDAETRALAKIASENRALAIESEHALVAV